MGGKTHVEPLLQEILHELLGDTWRDLVEADDVRGAMVKCQPSANQLGEITNLLVLLRTEGIFVEHADVKSGHTERRGIGRGGPDHCATASGMHASAAKQRRGVQR